MINYSTSFSGSLSCYDVTARKFKSVPVVLFVLTFLFSGFIAKAQTTLLTDDFNYSGALNTNGWTIHSGAGTNAINTTTGLTYSGFEGSGVGNAALVNNAGGEDVNKTFAAQSVNGQSVYFSMMVNVTEGSTGKTGDYFFTSGKPGGATFTAFAARVFARVVSGNVNFGISNTGTATYGTTNFSKNTTYLLVVKYTITTGAGNDNVSLWVLPSGVPLSEAAAGTPELTNTATNGTDTINTVALRQGSATTSPQIVVDGLRVGDSWSSAVKGNIFAPTVTTTTVSSITSTSSVSGGNVTNEGTTSVTAKGVVWGTSASPDTTLSTKTNAGSGGGTFTATLNGLSPNTKYFYRSYAVNSIGVSYGAQDTFWTKPFTPLSPLVTNPSTSSLDVEIPSTSDGNPSGVLYAIQDSISGKYVSATGELVVTPFYLPLSSWSLTQVTGLFASTTYYFRVVAKNSGNAVAFGLSSSGTTLTPTLPSLTVSPTSLVFDTTCINTPSVAKLFSFSGSSLDGTDVVIEGFSFNATGQVFSFSTNPSGPFTSTLTFSGYGTSIASTNVYVKYAPEFAGDDQGDISVTGGGTFASVSASITGINTPPAVGSPSSAFIAGYSASLGGNVSSIGCSNVIERGIYWSTDSSFANGAGTKVSESGSFGAAAFSVSVTGLPPGTAIYYKAFATNNGGTVYSARASFTTGAPDAPVAAAATNVEGTSLTANWNAVSGADSYRLDVAATSVFVGPGYATDLFISEYVEGSASNKYIEIYNGTGATVNLADYQLRSYANGGTSPSSTALTGSLAHGQTVVYKNSAATVYTGPAITASSVNFNGDDAVALYRVSTASNVDIIGRIGEDPGTEWTATGGFSTLDKTLVRKASVTSGVTVNPAAGFPTLGTEWDVYPIDNVASLGSHSMTITPSNMLPGYENLTVSGLSQSVTGLATGTTYYYRVRAAAGSTISANSNTVSATTKQSQTITFDPLAAKTYGDPSFDLTATASSGLPVTYTSSNPAVATVTGSTVTILAAGSTNIVATQDGDAQYVAATAVTRTLTVNKASQTISFDPIPNKLDTDPAFALSATASSGLPVSYSSSNTSVATVSGNIVTIVGLGSTIITASQAGNDNFSAAPDAARSMLVLSSTAQDQTITFNSLAAKTYGDAPFQLTATASSGLTVSYSSSNTSVATVSGDVVTILSAGTTTITAIQDGNTTYNAATPVSQTLTVSQKALTVTGALAINRAFDSTVTVHVDRSASTVNGIVGSDIVTVIGTTGTMANINAGAGKAVTTAWTLNGTDASKYSLTQPDYLTVDIAQLSQTITFPSMGVKTYTSPKFKLLATSSSKLPVSYSSSDPLVATIVGDSVTITGVGTALITASQSGDVNYTAAVSVDSSLVVNKASQFITFSTVITSKTTADAPFTVSVSASSGLPVTITSSNPAVATVTDSTVTIVGIGTTTLTAVADSGTNYRSATPSVRTLNVTGPILLGWDLTGITSTATPATYTATNANIGIDTASGKGNISRGSAAPASQAANSFRTTGFQNNGIAASNTDYFQVVLKPSTGKIVSVNSIVANLAGTSSFAAASTTTPPGGVRNQFAFSLNGTNFTLIDTAVVTVGTPASFVLNLSSVAALQNLGSSSTLTLRYYASGQTSSGGWGFNSPNAGIYGVAVGGTVADVQLPVITSNNTASGTVASAFTYNITASNFPSSYGATGLPPGLSVNTSTGAITGTPTSAGVYNATISATNDGGTATQNLEITISKADQAITFGSLAAKTYGDAGFNLSATASSGLAVSYSSSNTAVATVSGNTVTIVGAGSATITASQAGNDNYNAAATVDQVLVVNKANQTITFGALADKLDTDAPFALTAASTSGLAISYSSSNTSVITVSGSTATIVGPGVATITASQSGNDNYNAAVSVDQNQAVISTALLDQTITFGPLSDKTYGDASFQLTAAASSGLSVSYSSSNTSVATVSGDIVTIVGPGAANIIAAQAGNGTYNPAPSVTQSLTVNKKTLTVSGAVAQDKVYDGNTNAIISGATLNGVVGSDAVTISGGGSFADANAGSGISVTAALVLGGSDAAKYILQQPAGLSANITQASQSITFGSLAPRTTASAPFTLNGVSSSGLTVAYASSNTSVATVSGNTVTIIGAGTTNITASQAGNGNYLPATDVVQSLVVTLAPTFVTWTFSNGASADSLPVGGANAVNGLTISKMTRGNSTGTSTFLASSSVSSVYTGASGTFNAGVASKNGGFDKDTSSYFSFTLTPDLNKRVKLDSISFGNRSTTSGPRGLIVRSSLDNFASTIALDSSLNNSAWALKKPVTTSVTSEYSTPITFRIYGFNNGGVATSGTVNWRIDDVKLALFVETCPAPVNPGIISGSNTVCSGGTTTLSSDGDAGGTWSSSNNAVATVSASGEVAGVSAGAVTISYSVTGICGVRSATYSMSVLPLVTAGSVSGSSSVCALASTTLTASGATAGGTWTSSNIAAATVNSSTGEVTGVAAGTTTITYTVTGSCNTSSSSASLTVNPVSNAGSISGSNSVCVGGNTTLSSDGDVGGAWSSSNTAVATVNATSGEVSGVSAGTTTISYTVTGTCGSSTANYSVTVNNCNSIVNVKAYIQGYYDDVAGAMRPALQNSSVSGATLSQADSITVEIHDGTTGAIIGSPVKTILNTNGTSQAVFPALSGSHYIVVKHRNSIEVWSAAPVTMGSVVNYDFSTAASQAYSSNQVQVAAGVFALWSGDLNQDGAIESADYAAMENDVLAVSFGYNPSDITGDGVTESADYALIENNLLQVIFAQKPF